MLAFCRSIVLSVFALFQGGGTVATTLRVALRAHITPYGGHIGLSLFPTCGSDLRRRKRQVQRVEVISLGRTCLAHTGSQGIALPGLQHVRGEHCFVAVLMRHLCWQRRVWLLAGQTTVTLS